MSLKAVELPFIPPKTAILFYPNLCMEWKPRGHGRGPYYEVILEMLIVKSSSFTFS